MLDSVFKAPPSAQRFRVVVDAGSPEIGVDAVLALIEDAAAGLVAEGIAPGQRVLFCGEQGLPAFVAFWAAMAVGAVFVPVDPAWPEFMCRKAIGKIRPRLAVVEALDENRLWQRLAAELPTCTINPAGALLTQVARSPFQAAIIASEAPAACLFTSGSTGDPKAVVLSRQALLNSAALVVQTFAWQAGERLLNLPDPHTMSGLRNALLAAPMAGMTWVCAPKPARANVFSLLGVLDSAQAQRVVAAPLLLRHINLLGDRVDKEVLAATRAFYCTGTDLSRAEVLAFYQRFSIPVVNYYGLTETVGLCLSQKLENWSPEDASIGWPVGCQMRLLDEQGQPAADGEVGELQVRLQYPMSCYFEDAAATAERFDGDWLRTEDLVRCDAEGRVIIVGRRSNFIKTMSTEKVQPQEIEAVIEQYAGVAEAAVCGLPDPVGAERIAALLVASAECTEAARKGSTLAEFVSERLGQARTPSVFRWVNAIPRNASGKILRKQLRNYFDGPDER